MSTVIAGDNVLVTFNGEVSGQRIMSTFGYVISSVTGSFDDSALAIAFQSAIAAAGKLEDAYLACCPSNYTRGLMWWQIIRPGRVIQRKLTMTSVGNNSGEIADTPNVAAVLLRRGDTANRKNISTLHVPSPTTSNWIDGGKWTVQALNALNPLCTEVGRVYSLTGGTTCTLSPSILNGPLSSNVTPITAVSVMETVRVMRRRTVGLGI
jgi:hypothetical protein